MRLSTVLPTLMICIIAAAVAYMVAGDAIGNLQLVATLLMLLVYLTVTSVHPAAGLVLISATLPFLGMFRRILYAQSPVSLDYTLLAIPIYTAIMMAVISLSYRERLRAILRESLTTRLLLLLLGVAVLQIANPSQGGLSVGMAGALFYVVPLCWYLIGRMFLTEHSMRLVLAATVSASLAAGLFGFDET